MTDEERFEQRVAFAVGILAWFLIAVMIGLAIIL